MTLLTAFTLHKVILLCLVVLNKRPGVASLSSQNDPLKKVHTLCPFILRQKCISTGCCNISATWEYSWAFRARTESPQVSSDTICHCLSMGRCHQTKGEAASYSPFTHHSLNAYGLPALHRLLRFQPITLAFLSFVASENINVQRTVTLWTSVRNLADCALCSLGSRRFSHFARQGTYKVIGWIQCLHRSLSTIPAKTLLE